MSRRESDRGLCLSRRHLTSYVTVTKRAEATTTRKCLRPPNITPTPSCIHTHHSSRASARRDRPWVVPGPPLIARSHTSSQSVDGLLSPAAFPVQRLPRLSYCSQPEHTLSSCHPARPDLLQISFIILRSVQPGIFIFYFYFFFVFYFFCFFWGRFRGIWRFPG